jgi:hypothetical protein
VIVVYELFILIQGTQLIVIVVEVAILFLKQSNQNFSFQDPRVGLRLPTFLHRLGFAHLLPMFPKKQYVYATDLRNLDHIGMFR